MLQQNNDFINPEELRDCIKSLIWTIDELSTIKRYSKLLDVALTDDFSDDPDFVYTCIDTFRKNFTVSHPDYLLENVEKAYYLLCKISIQQEPPPNP